MAWIGRDEGGGTRRRQWDFPAGEDKVRILTNVFYSKTVGDKALSSSGTTLARDFRLFSVATRK